MSYALGRRASEEPGFTHLSLEARITSSSSGSSTGARHGAVSKASELHNLSLVFTRALSLTWGLVLSCRPETCGSTMSWESQRLKSVATVRRAHPVESHSRREDQSFPARASVYGQHDAPKNARAEWRIVWTASDVALPKRRWHGGSDSRRI